MHQHNVREMKRHPEPDQAPYAVEPRGKLSLQALAAGARLAVKLPLTRGLNSVMAQLQPIFTLGLVDPRAELVSTYSGSRKMGSVSPTTKNEAAHEKNQDSRLCLAVTVGR